MILIFMIVMFVEEMGILTWMNWRRMAPQRKFLSLPFSQKFLFFYMYQLGLVCNFISVQPTEIANYSATFFGIYCFSLFTQRNLLNATYFTLHMTFNKFCNPNCYCTISGLNLFKNLLLFFCSFIWLIIHLTNNISRRVVQNCQFGSEMSLIR